MSTSLENELRATFAAHASQVPPHPDPYRVTRRRIDHARRRRVAVTAGTLVAAAALILGALPGLHAIDRPDHFSADGQAALHWPTRGSLAGNRALLNELARRALAETTGLAHSTVHVLYAGDDGKHRVALVTLVTKQVTGEVVLTGPSMAPTAQSMSSTTIYRPQPTSGHILGGDPIAWFNTIGKTLLVVGPPGMSEIEVAPVLTFRPDGTATGKVRTIRAKSGALLTEIPTGVLNPMQIRARINGRYSPPELPIVAFATAPSGWRTALGKAIAHAPGHIDLGHATHFLTQMASGIGADGSDLRYKLWWGGPVGTGRTAIIATVSAPGRPTFRMVQTTVNDDLKHPGKWREYVSEIPAATLAAPPSMGWFANGGSSTGDPVLPADIVYAPGTQGDTVELLDQGNVIATAHTNAAGVAILPPNPSATQYRIVDAQGHTVQSGNIIRENLDTLGLPIHW